MDIGDEKEEIKHGKIITVLRNEELHVVDDIFYSDKIKCDSFG